MRSGGVCQAKRGIDPPIASPRNVTEVGAPRCHVSPPAAAGGDTDAHFIQSPLIMICPAISIRQDLDGHLHRPQPLDEACPPVRRTSSRSSQFLSGEVPICKRVVVGETVELVRRVVIRCRRRIVSRCCSGEFLLGIRASSFVSGGPGRGRRIPASVDSIMLVGTVRQLVEHDVINTAQPSVRIGIVRIRRGRRPRDVRLLLSRTATAI